MKEHDTNANGAYSTCIGTAPKIVGRNRNTVLFCWFLLLNFRGFANLKAPRSPASPQTDVFSLFPAPQRPFSRVSLISPLNIHGCSPAFFYTAAAPSFIIPVPFRSNTFRKRLTRFLISFLDFPLPTISELLVYLASIRGSFGT